MSETPMAVPGATAMTKAGSVPKKTPKRKANAVKVAESLRVRMYNVGFGDSFLITTPDRRTILVDCGFHLAGRGPLTGNDLAERIIADVVAETGKKHLDVVIATHRHSDHIYGFNAKAWSQVSVGEVWLPWVENPDDRQAKHLWEKRKAFADDLFKALAGFALAASAREDVEFMLWNAGVSIPFGDFGMMQAWNNATALDTLLNGFARRLRPAPRYLPATSTFPETFETEVLPGVKTTVLGPSRNPKLLTELSPEADGETYRALMVALREREDVAARQQAGPFPYVWWAPPAPGGEPPYHAYLRDLAPRLDPVFAATALDDHINATSLVLVLQIGTARLLLPGDAEWASWKVILENRDAQALLRTTTFLKVGHHGSHNATPRSLVEKYLPRDIPAMVSTQEGRGTYRNNIPLPNLLAALAGKAITAVRSDHPPEEAPAGFTVDPQQSCVDLLIPC